MRQVKNREHEGIFDKRSRGSEVLLGRSKGDDAKYSTVYSYQGFSQIPRRVQTPPRPH
jgi:hypothetical protein